MAGNLPTQHWPTSLRNGDIAFCQVATEILNFINELKKKVNYIPQHKKVFTGEGTYTSKHSCAIMFIAILIAMIFHSDKRFGLVGLGQGGWDTCAGIKGRHYGHYGTSFRGPRYSQKCRPRIQTSANLLQWLATRIRDMPWDCKHGRDTKQSD